MDGTYDMPVPKPPDTLEVDPASPDPVAGISGDPLCRMLGRLEASIEQPAPIWTKYADPLCSELDRVEASVEQRFPFIDPMSDGLRYALDRPERELKKKLPVEPELRRDSIEGTPPSKQEGLPQVLSKGQEPRLIPMPSQRPEVVRRELASSRQYPEPIRRMTGHSTGIRNSGNGFDWYCNIHRQWVAKDECDDCPDFEETDYEPEDKVDKRCRHSFFTSSEEWDKNLNETFDSDDEINE